MPVNVGALCTTVDQARAAATGDLRLFFCEACSYVWNGAHEAAKHDYAPGYEISLHHSPVFQEFLANLTQSLVEKYDLHGRSVLEIACGTGHFLRMLCAAGGNRGTGIDPVIEHEGVEAVGTSEITFHRDLLSEKYAEPPCDFICCRQALHVMSNPKEFMRLVRRIIGDARRTPVYFEVVNASKIFETQNAWQLIYEYRSFFSAASLSRLFSECAFDVVDVSPCYEDGQYLQIEALPADGHHPPTAAPSEELEALRTHVVTFSRDVRQKIADWEQRLTLIRQTDRRIVAWGAGGRGINFLSLIKGSECIRYIVDINPTRQGLYVPRSAQKVVAPAFLQEYRPDIVVVTNPTYEREVRAQLDEMRVGCDILVAA